MDQMLCNLTCLKKNFTALPRVQKLPLQKCKKFKGQPVTNLVILYGLNKGNADVRPKILLLSPVEDKLCQFEWLSRISCTTLDRMQDYFNGTEHKHNAIITVENKVLQDYTYIMWLDD